MDHTLLLAPIALALFFFVPGYLLTRTLWPEWRLQGEKALERGIVTITSAFVFSTAITVLAGFYLGNVGLFQAGPGDPVLEEVLGGLSVALLAMGWWRGAYSREPPPAPAYAKAPRFGEEDVEEFTKEMASMARDERRLRHEIRVAGRADEGKVKRLEGELEALLTRRRVIEAEREERLGT